MDILKEVSICGIFLVFVSKDHNITMVGNPSKSKFYNEYIWKNWIPYKEKDHIKLVATTMMVVEVVVKGHKMEGGTKLNKFN